MADRASSPPAPIPLVRGKYLKSPVRKSGAQLGAAWLKKAVTDQGVSQRFLAAQLGVDQTWVEEVVNGRISMAFGDCFVLPRSLRRALGLYLMNSAENDNEHG